MSPGVNLEMSLLIEALVAVGHATLVSLSRFYNFRLNWYWSENLKLSLGWKHAEFGEPVLRNAGSLQKAAELIVLRAAVIF